MTNDNLPSDTSTGQTTQASGAPDESIRRTIRAMAKGQRIDIETWLSTLDKLYDDKEYLSPQRISYTLPFLTEEQKTWNENKLEPKFSTTPQVIIREEHPVYIVKDKITGAETRVHINDIRPIYVQN